MEEGTQRGVAAAFPPPPPFWRHFSRANLNKLEDAKRAAARPDDDHEKRTTSKGWTPAELQALDVAPELKYLIPPEPPTTDYVLFGETQQLSPNPPSLGDQGITQLYPSSSATSGHAYHLTKITKSLLLNFLELTGILSIAPEHAEEKLQMIRTLFINAYHLLNLYRPHQARESLSELIERRIEMAREDVKQMEEIEGRVAGWLDMMSKGDKVEEANDDKMQVEKEGEADQKKNPKRVSENDREIEDARIMWRLLDEIEEAG
ncbi:mediator of RNA polymerase II transcription subunit 7 [Trichophyton mentagrophytes]|nr:mediator of RNA polymerase II transcription subunit 7 [Trichophyton mentagrophytes]